MTVSTTESTRFLPNFGLLACLLVCNSRAQNLSSTLDIHPEIILKFAIRMLELHLALVTLHIEL